MFGLCAAKPSPSEGKLLLLNGISHHAEVAAVIRQQVPHNLLKELHPDMMYMPGSAVPMKSEYPNPSQRMAKLIERAQLLTAAGHNVCLQINDPTRASQNLAKQMLHNVPVHVTSALMYSPLAQLTKGKTADQAARDLVNFGTLFTGRTNGPGVDYLSRKQFDAALGALAKQFGQPGQAQFHHLGQYLTRSLGFHTPSVKGVYVHARHPADIVVNVSNVNKAAKAVWGFMDANKARSALFSVAPAMQNFACAGCKVPLAKGICGTCLQRLHAVNLKGTNCACTWPELANQSLSGTLVNDRQYESLELAKVDCEDLKAVCKGVSQTGPNSYSLRTSLSPQPNSAFPSWTKPACALSLEEIQAADADMSVKPTAVYQPVDRTLQSADDAPAPNKFSTLEEAQQACTKQAEKCSGITTSDYISYQLTGRHAAIGEATTAGSKSWLKVDMVAGGCQTDPFIAGALWDTLTAGDAKVQAVGVPDFVALLHQYNVPPSIAQVVFQSADLNHDLSLSKEEFNKWVCSAAFDATLGQYAGNIREAFRTKARSGRIAQGGSGREYGRAAAPVVAAPASATTPIGSTSDSGFNVGLNASKLGTGQRITSTEGADIAAYGEDLFPPEQKDDSWKPEIPPVLQDQKWVPGLNASLTEFHQGALLNPYEGWQSEPVDRDVREFCSKSLPIPADISQWDYDVSDPFANGASGIDDLLAAQADATAASQKAHEAAKAKYQSGPAPQRVVRPQRPQYPRPVAH